MFEPIVFSEFCESLRVVVPFIKLIVVCCKNCLSKSPVGLTVYTFVEFVAFTGMVDLVQVKERGMRVPVNVTILG